MAAALLLATGTGVFAFGLKQDKGRFDDLNIPDPSLVTDVASTRVDALPAGNGLRAGWERFSTEKQGSWRVQIDGRSGAPLLVEGPGIRWPVAVPQGTAATENVLRDLEASLREFVGQNRQLMLARDEELVLDRDATGPFGLDGFHVAFQRQVDGVVVEGDRYVFLMGRQNLMAFGTSRWTRVNVRTTPDLTPQTAIETMADYMELQGLSGVQLLAQPVLRIVPERAEGGNPHSAAYAGEIGKGYNAHLVWRVVLGVDGDPGTWVGMVDAHNGTMRAFFDDARYAQVKGGVHPESPDGICPSGCEQPNWPMPFAQVSIGGAPVVTANSYGFFSCTPLGSNAVTQLKSPTISISDACGAINESSVCGADIQLAVNSGTNCTVPAGGHSLGDTKASRSCFYTGNRLKERARGWVSGNAWLDSTQTQINSNVNSTCNANWSGGQLNMFRNGSGCNNTCEIAGVVQHEWGHGFDQNDGGGFDNSSEAYADITENLADHNSCVGRGFFQSGTCSGYGDTCLTCTGIRDMDWNARTQHTPAKMTGTLIGSCPGGGGPCGKEVHCEAYLAGEAVYDLAVRDLPAAGYDQATAWQIVDRIWYTSRTGSSGNMYTCTAGSGGCGATSLYQRLRTADDDDGNLANGTPHAAAIFAAFARHDIACGAAGDAANQSSSFPPVLTSLSLSGAGSTNSAILTIAHNPLVPDAIASFRILRNDISCDSAFAVVGSAAGSATTFTDTGLPNGMPIYYRVQGIGTTSPKHESAVSNCVAVTPQPFAGTVVLGAGAYSCTSAISISVVDGNIGAPTVNVTISSTTETTPETVTLTQVGPGDATYSGSIPATAAPPAADGQLSVANGDTITVHYVDADDGNGGTNVPHDSTASVDCLAPSITNVQSSNVTGNSARITWNTNEASDSRVQYGPTPPPGSNTTVSTLVTSHQVDLSSLLPCNDYVFSVASSDGQGNLASDNNGGTYYTFSTGQNVNPSYPSASPPVPIPDNNATGASMSLVVPDNKTILDINVKVNITHTYDGDFTIQLIPPGGSPIMLSNRRGSNGQNYTNTVFDDEAATAISSGTAPFTGSFRPESPLSVLDGTSSSGTWTLKVVDQANVDVGTIDNFTLTMLFPAVACGPHATTTTHTDVTDVCSGSGGGSGNGLWESGEDAAFSYAINNDGTGTLTGVTATITSPTPGVTILDGTATYPSLPPGATADADAPYFKIRVPAAAACDSDLQINVQISSDQGSWAGASFTHKVGQLIPGSLVALNESFVGGIPATWTVVDGGSGGGAAATWTTANPGARTFTSPLVAPVAAVDSDNAGTAASQNEELITPVLNLSTASSVSLEFDQFFRWYSGGTAEIADVDVRSSLTAGAWVNVLRQQNASSPNPDHKTVNITAQAAGAANVQIRFHYYQATFEWWWQVDNVKVTAIVPPACNNAVCSAPGGVAKPANGLGASRVDPTTIGVTWDAVSCTATNYELLYGNLASLPSYTLLGSVCGLGTSGSASWSSVPAGDLWFLVTGVDGAGTEATWGPASAGERNGGSASGQCGNAARNNGASCP